MESVSKRALGITGHVANAVMGTFHIFSSTAGCSGCSTSLCCMLPLQGWVFRFAEKQGFQNQKPSYGPFPPRLAIISMTCCGGRTDDIVRMLQKLDQAVERLHCGYIVAAGHWFYCGELRS